MASRPGISLEGEEQVFEDRLWPEFTGTCLVVQD